MADIVDDDVIVEEFDTGVSPSSKDSSVSPSSKKVATQEFSFGSVAVSEPAKNSPGNVQSSVVEDSSVISSPPVAFSLLGSSEVESGDIVSLDNLKAVSAAFDSGCQTIQSIVDSSSLPKATVLACLKWLQDNGLIALGGKFYCSLENVRSLQKQLNACVACYSSGKV